MHCGAVDTASAFKQFHIAADCRLPWNKLHAVSDGWLSRPRNRAASHSICALDAKFCERCVQRQPSPLQVAPQPISSRVRSVDAHSLLLLFRAQHCEKEAVSHDSSRDAVNWAIIAALCLLISGGYRERNSETKAVMQGRQQKGASRREQNNFTRGGCSGGKACVPKMNFVAIFSQHLGVNRGQKT